MVDVMTVMIALLLVEVSDPLENVLVVLSVGLVVFTSKVLLLVSEARVLGGVKVVVTVVIMYVVNVVSIAVVLVIISALVVVVYAREDVGGFEVLGEVEEVEKVKEVHADEVVSMMRLVDDTVGAADEVLTVW